MDIEAPYLQAIQAITGRTPGEKQRTIHNIAKQIAQAESSGGHPADAESQIPDVPEPLKPVIRVEVAKILHQYEGIIEALKSEDMNVVSRALQAKWFFDGSDSSLVNAQYFLENVLPEISLYARLRIVKNLGTYLKNTAVAADFFLTLTRRYGVSQAIPLLEACDEDFAYKMIIENKIVLSLRMVEVLYRKYPNLVIKYLMLSKPDDDEGRNLYRINISDYKYFLPEVANNRFEDFMEIYDMHGGMNVKLGKKGAKTFLKTQIRLLVEIPDRYLKLVSLKSVTRKLCVSDFRKMFKNLFPAEKKAFNYYTLNKYLQHYEPEREKMPLMLNTFREVYGKNLLSCKDLVHSDLIKALSTNDRVEQARLKLKGDKDWHLCTPESSWRCYLPTSESIPLLTKKIVHCSDASTRGMLLEQMIYTCKVNDDKDALLKVLNYIYDRHRNDQKSTFYNSLLAVYNSFDLATLSSAHWEILKKFIKWAEIQGDLADQCDTMAKVLGAGLHYCLLNSLPLDDFIRIFVDMRILTNHGSWNILTKYPDLEKKFLDLFIEVIPKQYPFEKEIWKEKEASLIFSIATSLWDFNKRHKVSNGKFKKLSVRDYPWLLQKIQVNVFGKNDGHDFPIDSYLRQLRRNDRDLYCASLRDLGKFWTFDTDVIIDVLREHPQRVLDNWKECLNQVKKTVHCEQRAPLVVTKSRWYQSLPIKFFTESLRTYNDLESGIGSVVILALLTDGVTYAKIIEPFIPNEEKIDVDNPLAKNNHSKLLAISNNLRNVNPPVPLDTIIRFCVGDYLQMAMRPLISVCRRKPVSKVIPFATTLVSRSVSVMKHGIRLIYLMAPLDESYTYLSDLWNAKDHTSIRLVVFTKIYDIFCKQSDSRSWRMVRTCLDNLNPNDDEIFKKLPKLSIVPNEYLHEYIKSVLNAMKSMGQTSEDPELYISISCKLINNIDERITRVLPEEYFQDLIKEYLFVFDYNSDIFKTGMSLTIDSYLTSSEEYNESRFKFFGDFFRHSVRVCWNKSHPKCFRFCPMNFMVHKFFAEICNKTEGFPLFDSNYSFQYCFDPCGGEEKQKMFESLLEIFLSALQPHQDGVSYLDLIYCIEYHKSQTWVDFGTRIAQKVPELIEILSPECVISMSDQLSTFVKHREFFESESREEKLLAIIEVFVNNGTIPCAFFAANMLFKNTTKKLNERHTAAVQSLRNSDHPGVAWILNGRLARFGYCPDKNE